MVNKGVFAAICGVLLFSCGYYVGLIRATTDQIKPDPIAVTADDAKRNILNKEIDDLRRSQKAQSQKVVYERKSTAEYSSLDYSEILKEKPKTDDATLTLTPKTPLDEVIIYDAKKEIQNRVDQYNRRCAKSRRSLISVSFITGYISRYGVSTGDVHFWTCFLPKAASSSLSVTVLLATGYLPLSHKNFVTEQEWNGGRNNCPKNNTTCLKQFNLMPQKYRYMGANLTNRSDKFISFIVGREPMSRLVSAWKDKIYRSEQRTFYYRKLKAAYRISGENSPKCSSYASSEEAWNQGCRLEFKDFVTWISRGNQFTDEHWSPASTVCSMCNSNFTFIGHSEHFGEDAQVLADMLNIPRSSLPDSYSLVNKHAASSNVNSKEQTPKTLEEMFDDVSKETLRGLLKIYKPDYEMLGYEIPSWLRDA